MSSFKNAAQAQRRTHRERSQPAHRKKFGLLEKHKDYVVRARDFNKKKKIIKQLKGVADEKNPDEFYRGMIKSKVVDGKHEIHKDNTLDHETVMLLKTQDANYINLKLQAERNKISKLKEVLHDTMGEKVNTHTVFVESDSEDIDFENLEKLPDAPAVNSATKKALGRAKKVQYNLLQTRIKRLQTLERASNKLQVNTIYTMLLRNFCFNSPLVNSASWYIPPSPRI